MSLNRENPRNPAAEVDSLFVDRWSPRAFIDEPLADWQVQTLFEAARWAPSCFNEQPWLFIYAVSAVDRQRFLPILVEGNQVWAKRAPLLLFVLARRTFAHNGKENRHAAFDAGAAWMSLALQARRLGLYAHAMAGFSRSRAYEILAVPEDEYDILAAIAVGHRGDPGQLPEAVAAREEPSERKAPAEVAREGTFSEANGS